MNAARFEKQLCERFCTSVSINPVPAGFAVSTAFSDRSGDRLTFYIVETIDGIRLEDDGSFLSNLVANDVAISQGTRGEILDAILDQSGVFWDRETFEIRTHDFKESELPERAIAFLSAVIRARDLELFTRDVVRSTFREDATAAIKDMFGQVAEIDEDTAIIPEFDADLVLKPLNGYSPRGAVYFVNSNEKLTEALLLQTEAQRLGRDDFTVIALLEDADMRQLSRRKFQRAQNRGLSMPIFRGDEDAALAAIGSKLNLATQVVGNA